MTVYYDHIMSMLQLPFWSLKSMIKWRPWNWHFLNVGCQKTWRFYSGAFRQCTEDCTQTRMFVFKLAMISSLLAGLAKGTYPLTFGDLDGVVLVSSLLHTKVACSQSCHGSCCGMRKTVGKYIGYKDDMPEDDEVWYNRVLFDDTMLRGHFTFRGTMTWGKSGWRLRILGTRRWMKAIGSNLDIRLQDSGFRVSGFQGFGYQIWFHGFWGSVVWTAQKRECYAGIWVCLAIFRLRHVPIETCFLLPFPILQIKMFTQNVYSK